MSNDDQSSESPGQKSWVERLGRAFNQQPRDREELKAVLRDAYERGLIDADAMAMMDGALEVSEMHVRDAMVPRSQMVVVPLDAPLSEFLPQILESGHSRFPVIGEDRDEVEGILLAKDLLRYFADPEHDFELRQVMRPPVVIPESKRLNMLLRDFRSSRNHMAIVVDEYGGVSGLITIEDVLEEIVGEIDDEHDEAEDPLIGRLTDGRYLVQALTPIETFNERFGSHLSDDDYDTIGGLVLSEFGRVPESGETMVLDERFEFRVTGADSRRIQKLEMRLLD